MRTITCVVEEWVLPHSLLQERLQLKDYLYAYLAFALIPTWVILSIPIMFKIEHLHELFLGSSFVRTLIKVKASIIDQVRLNAH